MVFNWEKLVAWIGATSCATACLMATTVISHGKGDTMFYLAVPFFAFGTTYCAKGMFMAGRWFRVLPLILIAAIPATANAQTYVQNGAILYERYTVSEPYIWCGRTYYRNVYKYKQVLNYAAADWRQKALDIIDKAKERQSFEETLNHLGAKGILSASNSGYGQHFQASYPSATGNVLGGFTSLEYNRYGDTSPLDANKAYERSMQTIDQFERSTALNARTGSEIHASVATLIHSNSEGARAVAELQETRALAKEMLQGMSLQNQTFAQLMQSMKPQSSESFRASSAQTQGGFTQPAITAQVQPAELTIEERTAVTERCATCHGAGSDSPKGGFRFDVGVALSEDQVGAVSLRVAADAPKHRVGRDGRPLEKDGQPVPYAMPPGDGQLSDREREAIRSAAKKLFFGAAGK